MGRQRESVVMPRALSALEMEWGVPEASRGTEGSYSVQQQWTVEGFGEMH